MADLRHLLAIYVVHAHRAGNAVPPHIDADARAALAAEPPAPAPAADGEREELAALINQAALGWEPEACLLGNMTASQLARAAALLRQPAPAPARGWLPMQIAPRDGTEILISNYFSIRIARWERGIGWVSQNEEEVFAVWWQPLPEQPRIPQPPQDEEVV